MPALPAEDLPEPVDASEARYRALLDIGQAVGAVLDLDQLLDTVMEKLTRLLDADRSTLFLVNGERGELWSRVAQGTETGRLALPVGHGLAGHVALTGYTVNVRDAYADPRFLAETDRLTGYRTQTLVATPLRGKDGQIIGVAEVLNKRGGGAFTPEDERTLASVSSVVGIALENAQLYATLLAQNAELEATQDRLRQKVAEVDLLFEIERAISETFSLDSLLELILGRAIATTGASAAAIYLRDEDAGELRFMRGGRLARPLVLASVPQGGVLESVLRDGEPVLRVRGEAIAGSLATTAGYNPRSLLCVPLGSPGASPHRRIVGALELVDKDVDAFTHDDVKLARLVAAQLARAVSIARARAASERADRLAMLGQMLGGVVHDLRSPLMVIDGYAELMSREQRAEERARHAGRIRNQVEHVNAMTREVLSFIRGEREVLRRQVALEAFWRDLAEALRTEMEGRGVAFELELAYAGAARFDEGKIRRLATNLARNAAQAMPEGGEFRIRCHAEGDALVIEFADNGPGLPREVASRPFAPFNSHGKPGGTGLGLAIVKEVVDSHEGEVTVTTRPGEGTRFTVRLPGCVASGPNDP